jgi:restriction system protein
VLKYDYQVRGLGDEPSWSDFYVDRPESLRILANHLIDGRARTGVLVGPAGAGKTALAIAFAQIFNQSRKNARSVHVHSWSPTEFIGAPDRGPVLLVVDDYDEGTRYSKEPAWRSTARQKNVRTLYVTRDLPKRLRYDFAHVLPGLSAAEMYELIAKRRPAFTSEPARLLIDKIVAASQGNARSLLETIEAFARGHVSLAGDEVFNPVVTPGLVDAAGRPLATQSAEYRQVVEDVSAVSADLLRQLTARPDTLYQLTSRKFEEVVAELLAQQGYEVTLTPKSKDGGKDIYAARRDGMGSFLYLVECKKWAPNHRVGVGVVRQLYGVAQLERASGAMVATTSFFTRGAHEFQQEIEYQLSLRDFFAIQQWLRQGRGTDA